MEPTGNSKTLGVSLTFSLLLHLILFSYLYTRGPLPEMKTIPITVDFLTIPRDAPMSVDPSGAEKTGPEIKIKAGKPGAPDASQPPPQVKVERQAVPEKAPPPVTAPPPAPVVPTPPPKPQPVEAGPSPVAKETPPSPAVQKPVDIAKVPSSTSAPGIKDLMPSKDTIARIGKEGAEAGEGGDGGLDEETVALDSTDLKYDSYLHGVKFKIEGVWKYPEEARRNALQGRGLVSFTIERDGSLSEVKLLTSSGYAILDEAIIKAIKSAAPFNPFVENMRVKRLNVVASFEYNMIRQRLWGR